VPYKALHTIAYPVPQKQPQNLSSEGTVLTCADNTMTTHYTEVFFINTCDRPYGMAQAATGDLHHSSTSTPPPHSYLQCQNACVHSRSLRVDIPPLLHAVENKKL